MIDFKKKIAHAEYNPKDTTKEQVKNYLNKLISEYGCIRISDFTHERVINNAELYYAICKFEPM